MEQLKIYKGEIKNKLISVEISDHEITDQVMQGNIVVIKKVFPEQVLLNLRRLVFEWGKSHGMSDPNDFYDHTKENHYCISSGVSTIQKTLHYFRAYNFNDIDSLDSLELKCAITEVCILLKDFYNRITKNKAEWSSDSSQLHPQIINYPAGGGYFARHTHPLLPQKIGVILSISKKGKDYFKGGTGFEVNGNSIEIDSVHDIGDIALFRYDLPHWISSIDIEDKMQLDTDRGRWTFIIPYY